MLEDDSRYLIYWLLRQSIEVKAHSGKRVAGTVERVYRDVMDGKVEVTVGGKRLAFVEPDAIMKDGDDVVFVYGVGQVRPETDEEVFSEARSASAAGESFDEMLHRTAPRLRRETRFVVRPSLQTCPP